MDLIGNSIAAVSTQWANGNRLASVVCYPGQAPVLEGFLESAAAPPAAKDDSSEDNFPPKRVCMSTGRQFK